MNWRYWILFPFIFPLACYVELTNKEKNNMWNDKYLSHWLLLWHDNLYRHK